MARSVRDLLRLRHFYGAVQNPFVITKYKGLDPEVIGSGIDGNVYPPSDGDTRRNRGTVLTAATVLITK